MDKSMNVTRITPPLSRGLAWNLKTKLADQRKLVESQESKLGNSEFRESIKMAQLQVWNPSMEPIGKKVRPEFSEALRRGG